MTKVSPLRYAGEFRISGIHVRSQSSAPPVRLWYPPASLVPARLSSRPSSHRFGVMNEYLGVVDWLARS